MHPAETEIPVSPSNLTQPMPGGSRLLRVLVENRLRLSSFQDEELLRMSKKDLREIIAMQDEELKRLRARLRAQEEQIKQLSLHSLISSGLGIVDSEAVAEYEDDVDEQMFALPKNVLQARSPHTPPCSPASGSPPKDLDSLRYLITGPVV